MSISQEEQGIKDFTQKSFSTSQLTTGNEKNQAPGKNSNCMDQILGANQQGFNYDMNKMGLSLDKPLSVSSSVSWGSSNLDSPMEDLEKINKLLKERYC